MKVKDCKISLEGIETKASGETTITGFFASFDTMDSDGDIFNKGAFKKSISENPDRIMHLLQHKADQPMARPTLSETDQGLKFTSTIGKEQMKVGYIADAVALYKGGVYNEHSVGFQTINEKSDGDANHITEVKLWEGSTVTWGANSNTPIIDLKNLDTQEKNDIAKRIELVCKALRTGGLTDDTYIGLEIELQQIKALIEPPKHSEPQINEVREYLINKLSKHI